MNVQSKHREEQKILDLAREYKKKGFSVITNPQKSDLPIFLRDSNYVPDLIVKSRTKKYIIEIKTSESLKNNDELMNIAERVNKNKNWEFLLVVTNPKEANTPIPSTEIDIEALKTSYLKYMRLFDKPDMDEYLDMYFIYGWSILEGLLFEGLKSIKQKLTTSSPRTTLRDGFSQGLLSRNDYSVLVELLNKRNSIIHGELRPSIKREDVFLLKNVLQKLYGELFLEIQKDFNYINYLKSLSEDSLDYEIDSKIADTQDYLIDADVVSSRIAETNSFAYYVDQYEVISHELFENYCAVKLTFTAAGEPDKERPFCGSIIAGEATAIIDEKGSVKYQDVTAEVDDL